MSDQGERCYGLHVSDRKVIDKIKTEFVWQFDYTTNRGLFIAAVRVNTFNRATNEWELLDYVTGKNVKDYPIPPHKWREALDELERRSVLTVEQERALESWRRDGGRRY